MRGSGWKRSETRDLTWCFLYCGCPGVVWVRHQEEIRICRPVRVSCYLICQCFSYEWPRLSPPPFPPLRLSPGSARPLPFAPKSVGPPPTAPSPATVPPRTIASPGAASTAHARRRRKRAMIRARPSSIVPSTAPARPSGHATQAAATSPPPPGPTTGNARPSPCARARARGVRGGPSAAPAPRRIRATAGAAVATVSATRM